MKKWLFLLLIIVACAEIVYINSQDFLVIVEASPNTQWVGKIDTFAVTSKPGEDIRWFKVNRPGVCWELSKTGELGMLRAYGSTPNFTYGWRLEEKKYPLWGDMNTVMPYETIRGCIPEDAKY